VAKISRMWWDRRYYYWRARQYQMILWTSWFGRTVLVRRWYIPKRLAYGSVDSIIWKLDYLETETVPRLSHLFWQEIKPFSKYSSSLVTGREIWVGWKRRRYFISREERVCFSTIPSQSPCETANFEFKSFALKRHADSSVCPVTAVEIYISLWSLFDKDSCLGPWTHRERLFRSHLSRARHKRDSRCTLVRYQLC